MTGIYFALIIGLLVGWYEKYPNNYYGYDLIVAVFGSLLVTQELLPYKRWLGQVDGWLKKIEGNDKLPDLTKMIQLRINGERVLYIRKKEDTYEFYFYNSENWVMTPAKGTRKGKPQVKITYPWK